MPRSAACRRILAGCVAAGLALPAAAATFVTLERPQPYDLLATGFVLDEEVRVEIEATGLEMGDDAFWHRFVPFHDRDTLLVYAWLIDAETREAVWVMERDNSDAAWGGSMLREAHEHLKLGPGRYELYLYSGAGRNLDAQPEVEPSEETPWWERWWRRLSEERDDLTEELEQCSVRLSASGLSAGDVRRFDVRQPFPEALVSHAPQGDLELRATGLEVREPSEVRIYALIEKLGSSDGAADSAWLVDERTRERIWDAATAPSEAAGGGEKNHRIDVQLRLEPGRYILFSGTDDSHSFERFNAPPPVDPYAWGVSVLADAGWGSRAIRTFQPWDPAPALIDLTGVGDGELREQAFELDRGLELHVEAVGEMDRGDAYDHAWIVDDATGDAVWRMTWDGTHGAGGAEKNRVFDGLVALAAGRYRLYYVTDDSHSFPHWNAAAPFVPAAWGASVRPGPGFDPQAFRLVSGSAADSPDVLVRLVGLGDSERRTGRFHLDAPTRVRVRAVGEGTGGEMYDFGYIVDEGSGRTVWQMREAETDHAGGAAKNRSADTELTLGPGSFLAVFETDDSHSFPAWNASPPSDPLAWGMTVRRAR